MPASSIFGANVIPDLIVVSVDQLDALNAPQANELAIQRSQRATCGTQPVQLQ